MKVSFLGLEYVPGEAMVVTGVKGKKAPKGAVAGGYGTYVTVPTAQLWLKLKIDGEAGQADIYLLVKELTNGKKMAKKFRRELEAALEEEDKWTDKDGDLDLEKAVKRACKRLGF